MKKYLFLLGIIFLIPSFVHASENAAINIYSDKTKVNVGDTINVNVTINSSVPIGFYEYTLDYNPNKLSIVKGSAYIRNKTNDNKTKKITRNFSFKVIKEGSSKINLETYSFYSINDKKINVTVNPASISTSKDASNSSDNNYLSALEIKDGKLTPKFNKKITNYKVTLPNNAEEITITAKPEDSNAVVTGDGNFSLTDEDKSFKVVVTSSNGDKRTYTISLDKDTKPITVTIDNKDYTLIKDISEIDAPKGFIEKTITINNQKVTALYNKTIDYTLVALQDESGNTKLFIYDEQTKSYEPYKEIKSQITFIPLETSEIFMNLEKYHITINDYDLNCYKINSSSNYSFIYGINTENGEKGWYVYDKKENTIQRFNDDLDKYYNDKISSSKTIIYILSGATLLFGLLTIGIAIKSSKKR